MRGHDSTVHFGIYFVLQLILFGLLVLGTSEAQAACPVHTVSSQAAQQCLTGIAFMNSTVHTMDEICRMYEETLYCARRILHNEGLDCTLQDIAVSLSVFYTNVGPSNVSYSQCKIEPEVGSICSSEERLSQYALVACGPYLNQMQLVGDSTAACTYSSYLVECADRSVSSLGVTCSKAEIENAFKSLSSANYLARHVPGLDLDVCFQTVGVNEDKNCINYMTVFSFQNVTTCMSGLANVNLVDGMDPQDKMMQCSYVQEVEACMIKQLQGIGTNCTMAQMNSVLNTYVHLSPGMTSSLRQITQCPANDSYVSMSMCKDEFRMVSFFYTSGRTVFESLKDYNNKDLVCSTILSYASVLMKGLDTSCAPSEILSALTSPFGTAVIKGHYPGLDFHHCVVGPGSQSAGSNSFGRREKRNAVVVKE